MPKLPQDITIFNKEKIGNLFIYLSNNIDNLFLTKMLKIMYIIDEISVKEIGRPVTWLNYKVWKKGPVARKIYNNIKFEDASQFTDYIFVEKVHTKKINGLKIKPNNAFIDDSFSDYEIELIDKVILKYGKLNANELIELLHKENTLWHKAVMDNGLAEKFESDDYSDTSPYSIELKDAITDPFLGKMYDEMLDNIKFREYANA
jgi:uncharacterized phage-associated protein